MVRTAVIGAALLAVGLGCLAAGIVTAADVAELWDRYWPIMLFVVAVTIVAELSADAGLFDAVAARAAVVGRGRGVALWLLVVAVAAVSTVFLSLDTTALLVTPAVVLLARRVGMDPLPFAITAVWIANTGSLLLPVSNLTNLLASTAMGDPHPIAFATAMWLPALIGILLPAAIVCVVFRRALFVRYRPLAGPAAPSDPALLRWSAWVVVVLMVLLVSGLPVWLSAGLAATTLVVVFAFRRRSSLSPRMVPWPLALVVAGLFLTITAADHLGAVRLLGAVAGDADDTAGLLRLAGVSATAANVVNNLPAYLAMETVAGSPLRLAAVLVGVNAGAIITPWASLATLLWHDRMRRLGMPVPWRIFVLLGLVAAPVTVAACTLALGTGGVL